MKRIRVILADGSYLHLESLWKQWQNMSDFDVVASVTSGTSLLAMIARSKPDIVVMDLELREMDGLEVLRRLNNTDSKPLILVYSAKLEDAVIRQCAKYGVDYFICKPAEPAYLAKRIRMLCKAGDNDRCTVFKNDGYNAQVKSKVSQLLNAIGMPNKLSGYRYLRRALLQVVENPKMLDDLATGLYVIIAKDEGTTPVNVERSMRYAIEFVFMYGSIDALQALFGFTVNDDKGKPSNREFIAMLSDHLSLSMSANAS